MQPAVEIRRQLVKGAPDMRTRSRSRHCRFKVPLRCENIERAGNDDALALFVKRTSAQTNSLPAKARTDRDAAQGLAQLVLRHWLDTMQAAQAAA
ncbi:hypothetical protein [Streptomyces sp. NPDC050848]|uniref:hypothetical protein n=1 Tax=Streptomyces sp. NPDC050848 TaxID=3155791 RepID=UPI0033C004AB